MEPYSYSCAVPSWLECQKLLSGMPSRHVILMSLGLAWTGTLLSAQGLGCVDFAWKFLCLGGGVDSMHMPASTFECLPCLPTVRAAGRPAKLARPQA